ncbi:AbfB domain-containing protein, partial [Parafrankia sp. FMc6]|uniref:AbfB domain-containing protein n=1 Tax=Parafrankia soli TaxID=2599596 RepID=UPI0034D67E27
VSRVQSYNYQDRYVRHVGATVRIDASVTPAADGQWRVVDGLTGGTGYVSFESVNSPGYYLRHDGLNLSLVQYDGSASFRADASFKQILGLANSAWNSFQAYSYPDRYIRHYAFGLRVTAVTNDLGRADATFRFTG